MSELGQKIITAVREAAAGSPNYIYSGTCQYVRHGNPACLVGRGLWEAGLINAWLERSHLNSEPVDLLIREMDWEIDDDEIRWLATAQEQQDSGYPWRDAVDYADEAEGEIHAVR